MSGRPSSVRLFTIRGVRVGVSVSWFVILFVLIYVLSPRFRVELHGSQTAAYVTTVATVLALFASILVHEFGHAVAARRRGVVVTAIDLNLFGGLTAMDREPPTPSDDFTIAVAGPLATVAVILVCIGAGLAVAGGHRLHEAIVLDPGVQVTPVLLGLSWMIPLNIGLLAFNLLPALPLDGGRIARSAAWRVSGDRRRATVVAARLGQLLALVMVAVGVYAVTGAQQRSWSYGLYAFLLAWILYTAAREEIARSALGERVDGVCVADIMDTQPVTIDAELPAGQALQEYFWRYRWSWFAVVDGDGRYVGIAREAAVQASVDAGEGWVRTGSLAGAGHTWQIAADSPVTALLGAEGLRELGAMMVVDGGGALRGVVTVEQVRRALTAAVPV